MRKSAPKQRKAIWNAPASERTAAFAEMDRFDATDAKPLSKQGEALWNRAKRGRGRPRKPEAQKTRRVVISVDPLLLQRMDAYAKAQGLDRSKVIARGVEKLIA